MRKFKHKHTGDIVQTSCEKGYYKNINIPMGNLLPGKYIENSNDWEEIIEKEYEILEYYQKEYTYSKIHQNWDYVSKQNYPIKTVKRLSDGEVFTIGDKINILNRTDNYNNLKIRGFSIDNMGNCIVSTKDEVDRGYYCRKGCNISIIEHYKQKLFTTEDGVEIFEDDTYYALEDNYKDIWLKVVKYIGCSEPNGIKQFSTKKAAEEYILMNKPCLSINDVISMSISTAWDLGKIKELVKERL